MNVYKLLAVAYIQATLLFTLLSINMHIFFYVSMCIFFSFETLGAIDSLKFNGLKRKFIGSYEKTRYGN